MQRMGALVVAGTLFMSAVCLEAVEYSVGCKSGLGMAILYGKNANRYSKEIIKGLTDIEAEAKEAMRVGFSGGLAFSAAFNDYAVLQLECLYSMNGESGTFDTTRPFEGAPRIAVKTAVKLDYVSLPVLFKASIPAGPVFKPFLFAGTSIGILLSAENSGTATFTYLFPPGNTKTEAMDVNIKNETGIFDFGLVIGGGVEIGIGPGRATIDAQYHPGLLTVTKGTKEGGNESDVKNSLVSVSLGYLFTIRKKE